jgi:hypothetical protein
VFWDRDPETLSQKQRVALRSGFLGIDSLGWSTLAVVTEVTEAEREAATAQLAKQLLARFGAPDAKAARHAAEVEIAFAGSLCDHPAQTLLGVQRTVDSGEIRERFRTLRPREMATAGDALHAQARAFTFHEVEDGDDTAEQVDLRGFIEAGRK